MILSKTETMVKNGVVRTSLCWKLFLAAWMKSGLSTVQIHLFLVASYFFL